MMNIKRKAVAIIIVVLSLPQGHLTAQNEIVNFCKKKITIKDAFSSIQEQSNYLISTNYSGFDAAKKIKFTRETLSIDEAITQLAAKLKKPYLIRENYVVIMSDGSEAPPYPIYLIPPNVFINSDSLCAEKIEFPAKTPPEPELNNAAYYAERQNVEKKSKTPAYCENLPAIALRTNLLYGTITLTPNLGAEFRIAQKSSLLVSGNYNGWNRNGLKNNNKKLTHWIAESEYRFWPCEAFNGHFFGIHGFYGRFNLSGVKIPILPESGSENYRYDGTGFGGGISYGYQLMLGKKWNLEFNAGIGAGITTYDKANCQRCGAILEKNVKQTFVAPVKLGISLTYIIK